MSLVLIDEIRSKFIEYFKSKGHTLVPSSPVIPQDDKTLLFTNAGMNQFKDAFLGESQREYTRAVTCQKCVRVGGKHNDLDNVGHTSRHHTFFEMLGNFSFGDYSKKEAIGFAWEVATQVFEFPIDKLWVSIFETDDEAFTLWKEHIDENRIVRMGEKDNFWSMGETGPCGPCSELFIDRGEKYGPYTSPKDDAKGERFLEFWNLVFMQYNRDQNQKMTPLPNFCVDTGAGLERIVSLKMEVDTNFEIDLFQKLVQAIEKISGVKCVDENAPAFHVISDHLRALSFAISDGGIPSNVDRGYVLRKILRRAVRYGRKLGFDAPFIGKLVPLLIELMGSTYPELAQAKKKIIELVTLEEEAFFKTLRRGGNILSSIIEKALKHPDKQITGEDAFKLKDTYGFPLEEILLMAKDSGLTVNLDAFSLLEEKAKEMSRASREETTHKLSDNLFDNFTEKHGQVSFTGYESVSGEGTIIAIITDGEFKERLDKGKEGVIVLDRTPFYGEKGGQVGDAGMLSHEKATFKVTDAKIPASNVIVHYGTCLDGTLLLGEPVVASVEPKRRDDITCNHTATHLLHWALEEVLGSHLKQAGSLVSSDHLRLDFTHNKPVTRDEIREVEKLVNQTIWDDHRVSKYEKSFLEIQKDPSFKQLFTEKYGKMVRIIDINTFSKELCGGTHVDHLGQIGYFRIKKESSVGKGIRRIEAVTKSHAEAVARDQEEKLFACADLLKSTPPKLVEQTKSMLQEFARIKEEHRILRQKEVKTLALQSVKRAEKVDGITLLTLSPDIEIGEVAGFANLVMKELKSGVLLLGVQNQESCQLLLTLSDDLVKSGKSAKEWIVPLAECIDGRGGGKPNSARAGGSKPSGITQAFNLLKELCKTHS